MTNKLIKRSIIDYFWSITGIISKIISTLTGIVSIYEFLTNNISNQFNFHLNMNFEIVAATVVSIILMFWIIGTKLIEKGEIIDKDKINLAFGFVLIFIAILLFSIMGYKIINREFSLIHNIVNFILLNIILYQVFHEFYYEHEIYLEYLGYSFLIITLLFIMIILFQNKILTNIDFNDIFICLGYIFYGLFLYRQFIMISKHEGTIYEDIFL